MRGRPRKYNREEVRVRISLPKKVVKWLATHHVRLGFRLSAPQAAREIIVGEWEKTARTVND